MEKKKQIYFGLTTTAKSNWRDKVAEIREIGLKEVAILPTMLNPNERQELYNLLEKSGLETIPYCHLRDDFTVTEFEYLMNRWQTKLFSCHADVKGYALQGVLAKYATMIAVENPDVFVSGVDFSREAFAQHQVYGVCLDTAHYQTTKILDKKNFKKLEDILGPSPVIVNHLGPVHLGSMAKLFKKVSHSHYVNSLKELDYLKDISDIYFSNCLVMEAENTFLEQQQIKQYLELILKNKLN